MAEWSNLPTDLLNLIAIRLDNSFDLLRFHSVCKSWRSSLPSKSHKLPSHFPILPNHEISIDSDGFKISKRTILTLRLPDSISYANPNAWLIKVEQTETQPSKQTMQLFNPLSGTKLNPSVLHLPNTFDVSNIRITELGQEYVLSYVNGSRSALYGNLYMEKAVLRPEDSGFYTVLTIHVSGKLVVLKHGEENWFIIDDLPSPYDDVILFSGKFYAVDGTGRIVLVEIDPFPRVSFVADSVFGGDKKCLVESARDLLLVDIYLTFGPFEDSSDEQEDGVSEEIDIDMRERIIKFKVYRLDWDERAWIEVMSLNDRILFLGNNCTFSGLGSDLCGYEVNCIYFMDTCVSLGRSMQGSFMSRFSLDEGRYNLENSEIYAEPIWPLPDWVLSSSLKTASESSFSSASLDIEGSI